MSDKFIMLGDVHIGVRNANVQVMEHQLHCYETILFPYMKKHNITTILQYGDLFDTRKFSNHLVLHNWKRRFFDYMKTENIEFITLLGNHDIFYRNTLEVNSPAMFLPEYDNVTIIDKPTELDIHGVNFLVVPWLCEDNKEEVLAAIAETSSLYCAGHFEFAGFEINPGQMAHEGEDTKLFEKFDVLYSGHYHCKSHKGNIYYIGTFTEMTWIDYADPKGFLVFDTKTHKTKYIQNTNSLFVKIHYDDKDQGADYWKTVDVSTVKNSYVKIIVANKQDAYQFDKVVSRIISLEPIELKIMDEVEEFDLVELADSEIKTEDTTTLIELFVNQTDTHLDKSKVTSLLKSLYIESLHQGA